jgi:hypothetical protein
MTQYLGHLRCHLWYSNSYVLLCTRQILRSSFLESAPTYRVMQEVYSMSCSQVDCRFRLWLVGLSGDCCLAAPRHPPQI